MCVLCVIDCMSYIFTTQYDFIVDVTLFMYCVCVKTGEIFPNSEGQNPKIRDQPSLGFFWRSSLDLQMASPPMIYLIFSLVRSYPHN